MANKHLEGSGEKQFDEFIEDLEKLRHLVDIFQDSNNPRIRNLISKLRELADRSDRIGLNVKIADTVGNGVNIAGSFLVIGGLIAAPFTAGISTVLSVVGSGMAVAGGLTSVGANVTSTVATNNTVNEAKPILEELKKSVEKLAELLKESLQALERLENCLLNLDYWSKVFQDLLSDGKFTEKKIRELVDQLLSQLPVDSGRQLLRLPENFKNLVNGISAFYAIKTNPLLAQQAQQFCKLSCTERSHPSIAGDVSKVTTAFKGAPVALSTTQRVIGGAFAGFAIVTSTVSIIQTWTSSNETPAASELRRIADELEKAYPPIQQ